VLKAAQLLALTVDLALVAADFATETSLSIAFWAGFLSLNVQAAATSITLASVLKTAELLALTVDLTLIASDFATETSLSIAFWAGFLSLHVQAAATSVTLASVLKTAELLALIVDLALVAADFATETTLSIAFWAGFLSLHVQAAATSITLASVLKTAELLALTVDLTLIASDLSSETTLSIAFWAGFFGFDVSLLENVQAATLASMLKTAKLLALTIDLTLIASDLSSETTLSRTTVGWASLFGLNVEAVFAAAVL